MATSFLRELSELEKDGGIFGGLKLYVAGKKHQKLVEELDKKKIEWKNLGELKTTEKTLGEIDGHKIAVKSYGETLNEFDQIRKTISDRQDVFFSHLPSIAYLNPELGRTLIETYGSSMQREMQTLNAMQNQVLQMQQSEQERAKLELDILKSAREEHDVVLTTLMRDEKAQKAVVQTSRHGGIPKVHYLGEEPEDSAQVSRNRFSNDLDLIKYEADLDKGYRAEIADIEKEIRQYNEVLRATTIDLETIEADARERSKKIVKDPDDEKDMQKEINDYINTSIKNQYTVNQNILRAHPFTGETLITPTISDVDAYNFQIEDMKNRASSRLKDLFVRKLEGEIELELTKNQTKSRLGATALNPALIVADRLNRRKPAHSDPDEQKQAFNEVYVRYVSAIRFAADGKAEDVAPPIPIQAKINPRKVIGSALNTDVTHERAVKIFSRIPADDRTTERIYLYLESSNDFPKAEKETEKEWRHRLSLIAEIIFYYFNDSDVK